MATKKNENTVTEQTNNEETKTKATKPKTTTKKVKKFDPKEPIPCRSVTGGELILMGVKSQLQYIWADYGDVTYVEFQDLQALQSRRSGFLTKPRFIIENDDVIEQWSTMLKPIYDKITNTSIEELFKLSPSRFKAELSKVPEGVKEAIKTRAVQMIQTEELYDIRIVKVLDEVLNTDFVAMYLK